MSTSVADTGKLRVIVAGGGVAALETVLALAHLAPERTEVTLIAPEAEFAYRPMTIREPFAYDLVRLYPLERIARDARVSLQVGELERVDSDQRLLHTKDGQAFEYDALVLALGARANARYKHAVTIDNRYLDKTVHGLIQDIEGNYIHSLAFVAPGRMAWPLPLYELALLTAGRAYNAGIELATTIVTPEESPLAIFGPTASEHVAELLEQASIEVIGSAHVEVPNSREVVIDPGDRRLRVDRVIALPELYGPSVRGIPLGESGFISVNPLGRVHDVGPIYAAGDATEFPVKHGGLASQQADVVAQSIAALAGAAVTPEPFRPVIRGMLLTARRPRYFTARISNGTGFSSEVTDAPTWSPSRIASLHLSPFLDELDKKDAVGALP